MLDSALRRLHTRETQLADAHRAVTTGKAVTRASHDPGSADRALGIRADLRAREQLTRSIDDARSSLEATDQALSSATDVLHRVRELVVAGASTRSPSDRAALATEMTALRDELVGIANQRHGGRPLFSGYTDDAPVVQTGGTWSYAGDAGDIRRRVDEGETVTVNTTAAAAFGFADGDDVFSLLDGIIGRLTSGDTAGLSADLTSVDAARDRVGSAHATVGATAARVEKAADRNQATTLAMRGELSLVEDVPLAEAIMELELQEVAYQATLGALSRTLPPSLIDFLR